MIALVRNRVKLKLQWWKKFSGCKFTDFILVLLDIFPAGDCAIMLKINWPGKTKIA